MSDKISKDDEFTTVPAWVWWSCFPMLGAFSIIYAGVKINNNRLLLGGFGLLLSGLIIGNIPDKSNKLNSENPLIFVH